MTHKHEEDFVRYTVADVKAIRRMDFRRRVLEVVVAVLVVAIVVFVVWLKVRK